MKKRQLHIFAITWLTVIAILSIVVGCNPKVNERRPRLTLFVGVDVSGSFYRSGYYNDALSFVAHYIYGHMNELGGLAKPRELFVGAIGGKDRDEPKAFHPIHDFEGKDIAAIEANLREWFQPTDTLTDFNTFFHQVARIAKDRNLVLAPITVLVVTDGIPDLTDGSAKDGAQYVYKQISLDPLEYLSRNLTLRLVYVSPKVGETGENMFPGNGFVFGRWMQR